MYSFSDSEESDSNQKVRSKLYFVLFIYIYKYYKYWGIIIINYFNGLWNHEYNLFVIEYEIDKRSSEVTIYIIQYIYIYYI